MLERADVPRTPSQLTMSTSTLAHRQVRSTPRCSDRERARQIDQICVSWMVTSEGLKVAPNGGSGATPAASPERVAA